MAAELGQQTVELSTLVTRAAHDSYASLKELVDKCRSSELSDTDKKISILKFLSKTQQRMIRLNVLSKWCQQVPLIQHCQQLASTVSNHDMCFTQAADSLFFMHEGLQQARAPVYDVPSAIDILLTGSYQRLPKCVEDVGTQYALTEDQQKPALKKLDTLVRSKLLQVSIPKEFSDIKVSDGTAMLRVVGEFKVLITLGYRGHLSLWRILHLELLVGEKNKTVPPEADAEAELGGAEEWEGGAEEEEEERGAEEEEEVADPAAAEPGDCGGGGVSQHIGGVRGIMGAAAGLENRVVNDVGFGWYVRWWWWMRCAPTWVVHEM